MLSHAWRGLKASWFFSRDLPLQAAVALGSAGLGRPARPGQLWKACGIVLPVGFLAFWAIPQVTWVISPSIDAWAVRAAPGPIHKGDFVMFTLSHRLAGPKPVSVTKRALCMPGELLVEIEQQSVTGPKGATDGHYYCEGRFLGASKAMGRDGQPLDHLIWGTKRIPPGYVYVGSAHFSGFDSRYYGPIPVARLTRMEKIL